MYTVSSLAVLVVLLLVGLVTPLVSAASYSPDGLNWRANGQWRYFGTAMNGGVPNDKIMNAIATNISNFGQHTCEYQMKFAYTEPQRNNFSYSLADTIVTQASNNSIFMRCHNLVWHQSLPAWVTGTAWDNATLIAIMTNHITNVVTHFRGKCYAWDVVNEALYTDGTLRGSSNRTTEATSLWYTTIGPAYIPIAYRAAHAADPFARLYYSDFDAEILSRQAPKINGVVNNIVGLLRAYGAPIHGIGVQGHLTAATVPTAADLAAAMRVYTALGLEVAFTELDVRSSTTAPNRTAEAIGYANVVAACLAVVGCRGWTVWGFTEKYSWLTTSVPPYEGDLFNSTGSPMLAYEAAVAGLPMRLAGSGWNWVDWMSTGY